MAEYIEKRAALDEAKKHLIEQGCDCEVMIAIFEELQGLPTADVAPVVHGRWVYGEDVDIQCSVCGADAFTEGNYRQVKSRYCPNCGANMDLED